MSGVEVVVIIAAGALIGKAVHKHRKSKKHARLVAEHGAIEILEPTTTDRTSEDDDPAPEYSPRSENSNDLADDRDAQDLDLLPGYDEVTGPSPPARFVDADELDDARGGVTAARKTKRSRFSWTPARRLHRMRSEQQASA